MTPKRDRHTTFRPRRLARFPGYSKLTAPATRVPRGEEETGQLGAMRLLAFGHVRPPRGEILRWGRGWLGVRISTKM